MICTLCGGPSHAFFRDEKNGHEYFKCTVCDLRFLSPTYYLSHEKEKERYLLHLNDSGGTGYLEYLKPLIELLKITVIGNSSGLDFGCGAHSIIFLALERLGFTLEKYDPFFFPDPSPLEKKYDFLVCVEVAEHFYKPLESFRQMAMLLREGGGLGLMTVLFRPEIDFKTWYYRRDPTHVCFYSEATFHWLQSALGFSELTIIENRAIWLGSVKKGD